MTNNQIENTSNEILVRFNLLKTPIDLNKVTSKLGVNITHQDLDDSVSGFFIKKNSKNIIGVNKNHPPLRNRFTIAHEIGHFILHSEKPLFVDYYKGSILFRSENQTKDYKIEREANRFAAALLMPKLLVKKELNKFSNTENLEYDEKIYELSKKFKVSRQAMDFRLKSLGYYDYGF